MTGRVSWHIGREGGRGAKRRVYYVCDSPGGGE